MPTCPCCGHVWGKLLTPREQKKKAEEALQQQSKRKERQQMTRRHQMLALRQQPRPVTYAAIGKQFGVSTARARSIVLSEAWWVKDRLSRFTGTHDLSALLDRNLT
jgi:hypothetical protein